MTFRERCACGAEFEVEDGNFTGTQRISIGRHGAADVKGTIVHRPDGKIVQLTPLRGVI